jgi:hypothetical protein
MLLQHGKLQQPSGYRRAARKLSGSLQYAQLVECEPHAIVLHKMVLLLIDIYSR